MVARNRHLTNFATDIPLHNAPPAFRGSHSGHRYLLHRLCHLSADSYCTTEVSGGSAPSLSVDTVRLGPRAGEDGGWIIAQVDVGGGWQGRRLRTHRADGYISRERERGHVQPLRGSRRDWRLSGAAPRPFSTGAATQTRLNSLHVCGGRFKARG